MAQDPAGVADGSPDWASGLLPPDGIAWPPAPEVAPTAAPMGPLPTTGRRPQGADIQDWRSMPVESPAGYQGSATAPPSPAPRFEPWSVVAFCCAVVGAIPYTWVVPLLPLLAIAFGITGRRACSLDPALRGRAFAASAMVIGAGVLAVVALSVSSGWVQLFG
jgi:hypothetical protein